MCKAPVPHPSFNFESEWNLHKACLSWHLHALPECIVHEPSGMPHVLETEGLEEMKNVGAEAAHWAWSMLTWKDFDHMTLPVSQRSWDGTSLVVHLLCSGIPVQGAWVPVPCQGTINRSHMPQLKILHATTKMEDPAVVAATQQSRINKNLLYHQAEYSAWHTVDAYKMLV